jgi:hypothetical protein
MEDGDVRSVRQRIASDQRVREVPGVRGEGEVAGIDGPPPSQGAPAYVVADHRVPDSQGEGEAAVVREGERDLARGTVRAHVLGYETVTESRARHSLR